MHIELFCIYSQKALLNPYLLFNFQNSNKSQKRGLSGKLMILIYYSNLIVNIDRRKL